MDLSFFNPYPPMPQKAITVEELSQALKLVIEDSFDNVYVVGEISNLSQKSGHYYFSLKDATAQISGVIWRSTAARTKFKLKNGLQVVCRGRVEVYKPYGKYQLIVNEIEPKGIGGLELAFRQLQEKLTQEGLFDASRKKTMPPTIRRIAVITSLQGAAIRDFLNVLRRRSRRVSVLVFPVRVQGDGAAQEIAAAIERLNQTFAPPAVASAFSSAISVPKEDTDRILDAIVLIRGGGSTEDLWAFNEEVAVRAVAASQIPVVTGIGHEIDVSLSDLAADLHALTPTDAAGRLIPDDSENPLRLAQLANRLHRGIQLKWDRLATRLNDLARSRSFDSPADRILGSRRMSLDYLERRLEGSAKTILLKNQSRLEGVTAQLEALSPLAVLTRGYSLTETEKGKLVRRASDVQIGETIVTRLASGQIVSQVTAVENREPLDGQKGTTEK